MTKWEGSEPGKSRVNVTAAASCAEAKKGQRSARNNAQGRYRRQRPAAAGLCTSGTLAPTLPEDLSEAMPKRLCQKDTLGRTPGSIHLPTARWRTSVAEVWR